jgi:hypothetical protein
VGTSQINSLASSGFTEQHVPSNEPQWRAALLAVFQAATPSADFNKSPGRPPTSNRAPPQASHNASCVFTVRANKSAYHLQPSINLWIIPTRRTSVVKMSSQYVCALRGLLKHMPSGKRRNFVIGTCLFMRGCGLKLEVEVTLRRSVSQSVCLGVGNPFGAHAQILILPFFCRKIALLFVLGLALWREDGSVICSAICQWWESRRTHNHTSLSHLRLPRVPFPSLLTTRRDYGGSILTRLHTGMKLETWN